MQDLEKINFEQINKMWELIQKYQEKQITPGIMVGGKTGVGKSSVLNAILGKNVYETGVIPTTKDNNSKVWSTEAGDIKVIDVPGFGEAGFDEIYKKNMLKVSELEAHIFMLVLKGDDRALDHEVRFLNEWYKKDSLKHIQLLVVVNQIDKMNPVREWKPKEMNLKLPITEKEKNIRAYFKYMYDDLDVFKKLFEQERVIPVSSGEGNTPNDELYGIDDLKLKIYKLLPEAAKTLFARHSEIKELESNRIVNNYSKAVAGAVTVNFMPASDALIITPIQIAMIIHLGNLYGINLDKSVLSALVSSIGLSFAGRLTAQGIISFFPLIKNIVGPPLAFSLTYAMGKTVSSLFATGKTTANSDELKYYAEKYSEEAKAESKKMKNN